MKMDIWSYYGLWGTAFLWILLTGAFLLFVPFYKRAERRAAGFFIAFAIAFALEMFGIPFSIYIVLWITGRYLPVGVFWGYTLYGWFGMAGHYLYLGAIVGGGTLIIAGWAEIYRTEWKRDDGQLRLVRTGIYRYIRHPQYAGLILIASGALLDWATIPLIVLWPIVVRQYVALARTEEEELATRFPNEWADYAAGTGRFLPGRRLPRRGSTRRTPEKPDQSN